jgi:hypothetical protein
MSAQRIGISAIKIENFKGIGQTASLELRPITLLFGANSAGKSTILHALHYLRELLEHRSPDVDRTVAGGMLDLGGFQNLVFQHDLEHVVRLRLTLRPDDDGLPLYNTGALIPDEDQEDFDSDGNGWDVNGFTNIDSVWVEVAVAWDPREKKPFVQHYATGINGEEIARIASAPLIGLSPSHNATSKVLGPLGSVISGIFGRLDPTLVSYNVDHPIFEDLDDDSREMVLGLYLDYDAKEGDWPNLRLKGSTSNIPLFEHALRGDPTDDDEPDYNEFWSVASQVIVGPGELALNLLRQLRYIGPIREMPERLYTPPITTDGSRWATGLAAWDTLLRKPNQRVRVCDECSSSKLAMEVDRWLSDDALLATGYDLKVVPRVPHFVVRHARNGHENK